MGRLSHTFGDFRSDLGKGAICAWAHLYTRTHPRSAAKQDQAGS